MEARENQVRGIARVLWVDGGSVFGMENWEDMGSEGLGWARAWKAISRSVMLAAMGPRTVVVLRWHVAGEMDTRLWDGLRP